MTDFRLKRLAELLVGTRQNVYLLAKREFNAAFGDGDWDRIETVGGVFKCSECGLWLEVAEKEPDCTWCVSCYADIDT